MSITRSYPSVNQQHIVKLQRNGGAPFGSTTSTPIDVSSSCFYGDNVPGWRLKIRHGQSATTSLRGTKRTYREGYGSYNYSNIVSPSLVWGSAYGPLFAQSVAYTSITPNVADTDADNKARSKLLSHIIEAQNTWRGGNFLAEIRETFHFLKHPVESFYKRTWDFAGTLKTLGKTFRKRPLDFNKAAANAYLAYVFGVAPLINDISDASKLINDQLGAYRFDLKRVTGRGTVDTVSKSDTPWTQPSGFPSVAVRQHTTAKLSRNVRYYGCIKASSSATGQQLDSAGVNVYDILPAVWEATWYSFLFDYFLNISEVLDAMRYADVDLAWMNCTFRNFGVQQIDPIHFSGVQGSNNVSLTIDRSRTLQVYVDRRSAGLPYPKWNFRVPGMGSMKWLNVNALAIQCGVFRGFKR